MEHLVGQSVGRYRLDELLAAGGMGAVFKARDETLQRDVAVKLMHPHIASRPQFRDRFQQEARVAARLDHPGIVKVHDFGQEESRLYIVMEFLPGENLRDVLENLRDAGKWIVLPEAVELVRQVCLAVHYAHTQGVLHRDIKPGNIMLKPRSLERLPYQPVVFDLGLAKLAGGPLQTTDGTSMGTPAYMSPEQALGQPTDVRSDVYSLGILLYELVVGRLPFQPKTITEAIRCHTREQPPPPRSLRPDLPIQLDQVIQRALIKDPLGRYRDAATLAAAVGKVRTSPAHLSTPPSAFNPATQFGEAAAGQPSPSVAPQFESSPPGLSQDRVVLLLPGGRQTTRPITSRGLTLGRGKDNDLVLDSPKVSRHHARIEFDGLQYTVVDLNSTNGTYLGDTRLLPGIAEPLLPGSRLRIGDAWLALQRVSAATSAQGPRASVGGSAASVPQASRLGSSLASGRIALFLHTNQFHVDPGGSVAASLSLLNQGHQVDHFDLTVQGIPQAWVQLPMPTVRLLPGAQRDVPLIIHPPRAPESRAGAHPLTLRARSRDVPAESAEAAAILTISPYHDLGLELRPLKRTSPDPARFQVELKNQCNATLTVQLEARDLEELCSFRFSPPRPALLPDESATVQLHVSSAAPQRGSVTRAYPFTIYARCVEAPEAVQQISGEWVQEQPRFEVALHPPEQRGTHEARFSVNVTNSSSSDLDVRLSANDPSGACLYRFDQTQLLVPGGGRRDVGLTVTPRFPQPLAATQTYRFAVTARPSSMPTVERSARGRWTRVPVAPPAPRARRRPQPAPSAISRPVTAPRKPEPAEPTRRRRRIPVGLILLMVFLCATAVGLATWYFGTQTERELGDAATRLAAPRPTALPTSQPTLVRAQVVPPTATVEPTSSFGADVEMTPTRMAPTALPAHTDSLAYPHVPTDEPSPTATTLPFPYLTAPEVDAELDGVVQFEWLYPYDPPAGLAFQVLIWQEGDTGVRRGAADLWREPGPTEFQQLINLDEIENTSAGPGYYRWSVVVVDSSTLARKTGEGESRTFFYTGWP